MFVAWFTDGHFNENEFPVLGGGIREIPKYIIWCTQSLLHLDPLRIKESWKFRKLCICIIWQTSYQMCSLIRCDIPAEKVPSRVDVPKEKTDGNKMN